MRAELKLCGWIRATLDQAVPSCRTARSTLDPSRGPGREAWTAHLVNSCSMFRSKTPCAPARGERHGHEAHRRHPDGVGSSADAEAKTGVGQNQITALSKENGLMRLAQERASHLFKRGPTQAAHNTRGAERGGVAPPPKSRDILAVGQDHARLESKSRAVMNAPDERLSPCRIDGCGEKAFPVFDACHLYTRPQVISRSWIAVTYSKPRSPGNKTCWLSWV